MEQRTVLEVIPQSCNLVQPLPVDQVVIMCRSESMISQRFPGKGQELHFVLHDMLLIAKQFIDGPVHKRGNSISELIHLAIRAEIVPSQALLIEDFGCKENGIIRVLVTIPVRGYDIHDGVLFAQHTNKVLEIIVSLLESICNLRVCGAAEQTVLEQLVEDVSSMHPAGRKLE